MTRDSQSYRGYFIRWSVFTPSKDADRIWVERDGHLICWANTVDQAKEQIDTLEPVKVCAWCPNAAQLTADAQEAGFVVTHGLCAACSERVLAS